MNQNQNTCGVDDRFDRRTSILCGMGFTYGIVFDDVEVFIRTRGNRELCIPASTVRTTDEEGWEMLLERVQPK